MYALRTTEMSCATSFAFYIANLIGIISGNIH